MIVSLHFGSVRNISYPAIQGSVNIGLQSKNQLATCFYMACDLRIIFYIFLGKKNKGECEQKSGDLQSQITV